MHLSKWILWAATTIQLKVYLKRNNWNFYVLFKASFYNHWTIFCSLEMLQAVRMKIILMNTFLFIWMIFILSVLENIKDKKKFKIQTYIYIRTWNSIKYLIVNASRKHQLLEENWAPQKHWAFKNPFQIKHSRESQTYWRIYHTILILIWVPMKFRLGSIWSACGYIGRDSPRFNKWNWNLFRKFSSCRESI